MFRYIARRFLYIIPMLLGISSLTFLIMQLAPGDALTTMKLSPDISEEVYNAMRARFWLDQPPHMQYIRWIQQLFKGDMGHSFLWHAPVTWVLRQRLFNTLLLTLASTVLGWIIAIPIGIHSAVNQYSWSDKLLTFVAFIGVAIPNWFLGLLLLYLTVSRGWGFPVGGMTSIDFADFTFWEKTLDLARHMFLPTIVLTTGIVASLIRYMRSNLLDVLRQDYVTTARAKGLSNRVVINKHAVRNAINPLITIFGYQLGGILGGAALTEIVMNWPGIGSLMLNAVQGKDYYLVMGNLLIGAVMLILGNLVADILLAASDPRIRYE
ncbi:MAG: ABC transporter permease [Bacillota bacterium]|jgi:peptide/nickel transport system permease protein|nr:ABC transporter permease [Bacillota bacterium]HHT90288.1 ABC transporter permease [Bacillota bacterium]